MFVVTSVVMDLEHRLQKEKRVMRGLGMHLESGVQQIPHVHGTTSANLYIVAGHDLKISLKCHS
jgi:hypothetical protein